jgi:hypothetical protein
MCLTVVGVARQGRGAPQRGTTQMLAWLQFQTMEPCDLARVGSAQQGDLLLVRGPQGCPAVEPQIQA